jgi:hypothetical protein
VRNIGEHDFGLFYMDAWVIYGLWSKTALRKVTRDSRVGFIHRLALRIVTKGRGPALLNILVLDTCKHGTELFGPMKGREFLD